MIKLPFKLKHDDNSEQEAMSVMGLIFGMKTFSYQSFPLLLINVNRVIIPAMKGIPR